MIYPKYSVLLPVYHGDKPEFLKIAVDSMLCQTVAPDEIVIAIDGSIDSELASMIHEYKFKHDSLFNVYYYEANEGLAKLLNKALPLCRNEFIARMDADDYSVPERIEKQFSVLNKYPDIDIVGSNVDEFEGNTENVISRVLLPEMPCSVAKFAKRRCPVRHPALLYRKSDVLKVGSYQAERVEDYDLIVRMIQNGLVVYNIQQSLVYVRISKDFYKRRGGWKYLRCIYTMKKFFLESGFLSLGEFLFSFGGHAIIVLMPGCLRNFVYNKFLRG